MSSFAYSTIQAMRNHPKLCAGGSLFLLMIWLSSTVYGDDGMEIFKKKETGCIFSGFSGQLLYEGEPAAGAVLTRKYELFGRKGEDKSTADSNGRFQFDSVFWEFTEPFLTPTGFLVHQQIFVQYQNTETQIWGGAKGKTHEFSEFNGEPTDLICELTNKPKRVDIEEYGFITTRCVWKI